MVLSFGWLERAVCRMLTTVYIFVLLRVDLKILFVFVCLFVYTSFVYEEEINEKASNENFDS